MNRRTLQLCTVLAVAGGCGVDRSQWGIVVENLNGQPCSVTITYANLGGGGGGVSIDGVEPGKIVQLAAGHGTITVESVKVKRGADERSLSLHTEVPAGKQFKLTIAADGALKESVHSP